MSNAEKFKDVFGGMFASEIWAMEHHEFINWLNAEYREKWETEQMLGKPDYTEETKKLSNDKLLEQLEWCGHDSYYRKLYTTTVNEIRERLNHCSQAMESAQWKWDHATETYKCTNCNFEVCESDEMPIEGYNYCPQCGALIDYVIYETE